MLVVHALWAYGALQVWAEDSALPAHAPPRAGRMSRVPRPHPFAAAPGMLADALAAALAGTGAGDLPGKAADDEITLRLPSGADGPLASPELARPAAGISDDTGTVRRLSLTGWRVPVLGIAPADAAPLLTALAGLAPGDVVASGAAGYLAAVARFAADLTARGRVLPVLAEEDGGYAARWRPVLSAGDARHARELAAAMPPACRAVADADAGPASPAQPSPAQASPARCSRTCSTRSRTRQCAAGCPVPCCPRAGAAPRPAPASRNGCWLP